MTDNNIDVGSRVLKFPIKDNNKATLGPGIPSEIGKHVCYHRTRNGELVTHGMTELKIGDEVIVVNTKDGDKVAVRSGTPNPIRNCPPLAHFTYQHVEQHDPPDDSAQYRSYDIVLARPVDPHEIMNVVFTFEKDCDGGGVQPWYPCGGVWLGFGPEKDDYYWPQGSPYTTIRGQPAYGLGCDPFTLAGFCVGDNQWCIPDFLGRLYPWGAANWPVQAIHVHMSQQSTLYFWNYLRSRMVNVSICVGTVEDGWCQVLSLV